MPRYNFKCVECNKQFQYLALPTPPQDLMIECISCHVPLLETEQKNSIRRKKLRNLPIRFRKTVA